MSRRVHWLILAGAVVMISAFFAAAELSHPGDDGVAVGLTQVSLSLALALWVVVDARVRRLTPCHDFGFLVAVFLPVSVVWYVFWSRRWRGLLTLAGLLALWLLPMLSASIALTTMRH